MAGSSSFSKLLSDSQSLVNNIKREFSTEYSIEVYVISASGTPNEVYSGPSHDLSINSFREVLSCPMNQFFPTSCRHQVLVAPGTLYAFSVAGVPRKDTDLADLYPGKILKREFGWITGCDIPYFILDEFGTNLNYSSRSTCS
jgi:hypothetical protein